MKLTPSELKKQIHQYKQDAYIHRLLDACVSRMEELESIKKLLDEYEECSSLGYPTECRKIMKQIKDILDN